MGEMSILRNQVRDHLLRQIHDGRLKVGKTINLAELSRNLNVSVTPIREALSQLEYAKVIRAVPKTGFVVHRLSEREAIDLYGIMAQLEMMALDGLSFSEKDLKGLRSSLKRLSETDNALDQLKARFGFHDTLLQNCDNIVLIQILDNLKLRLLFYEQRLANNQDFHELMLNQHEAIIQAIEENNIPTACLVLKMNWTAVRDRVINQMGY
ncbi:GntR family transcriptional regulator [Muricauda sp. JGD-17]|uniref:GntR family transcriptional regulator n=1 Tax=Flagellimonas ochracea TaxID=2696472 RepID=A0A964T9Y0_9FLAO|nr:GntR family transcriptional regulator [Allomuricauda ochracea]NAY90947.1 GntR family transcriptional regulator [Allomuricauda ochracea]